MPSLHELLGEGGNDEEVGVCSGQGDGQDLFVSFFLCGGEMGVGWAAEKKERERGVYVRERRKRGRGRKKAS